MSTVYNRSDKNADSSLMLTIMGGVAEFERAMIRNASWKLEGQGKAGGNDWGRQSTMTAAEVRAIRNRAAAGDNKSALAREFGVTRQMIYNVFATQVGSYYAEYSVLPEYATTPPLH